MSNFASSCRRWISRFNSEGRDCGTLPVRRTEIGPSNRVNTGRLRPLSSENDKSIKSRTISAFDAVTLRDGDTGKGFVTKSLYTDEFCRVVTSSFDAGIQALSTIEKTRAARFIPFYSIMSLPIPIPHQPKLHGALLKNEQDVQLFERLAFMSRR